MTSRALSLCFGLLLVSFTAHAGVGFAGFEGRVDEGRLVPGAGTSESILSFSYQVRCSSDLPLRGITGRIEIEDRILRFDLHESNTSVEVALGATPTDVTSYKVILDASKNCELASFDSKLSYDTSQDLALRYSPFLMVRSDQLSNRYTDLPLALGYSWLQSGSNKILKYTIFFSDEDSESDTDGTDSQIGSYGRRTDIEWIYEIEFDPSGAIVDRRYQGSLLYQGDVETTDGISAHTINRFHGVTLAGSDHPILYNIINNNLFGDVPDSPQNGRKLEGYHLVPRKQLESPLAREAFMFDQPWMFKVSDLELARERKLSAASTEYLYILIDGEMDVGSFAAVVDLSGRGRFRSGGGKGSVGKLGEDLWGRESLTGVPVGADALSRFGQVHGKVSFEDVSSFLFTDVRMQKLRFFKLSAAGASYSVEEISNLFSCSYGLVGSSSCTF